MYSPGGTVKVGEGQTSQRSKYKFWQKKEEKTTDLYF